MENDIENLEIHIKDEDNDLDEMEQTDDSIYINEEDVLYNNDSDKIDYKKLFNMKFQNKADVKTKRKRNMNFTLQECELLISLITQSKIIDRYNHFKESYSFFERKEEWRRIEMIFNRCTKTIYRSATSLKEKYKIIKRNVLLKIKASMESEEKGQFVLNYKDFKNFEKKLLPILLPKYGILNEEQAKQHDMEHSRDNTNEGDFLNISIQSHTSRLSTDSFPSSGRQTEDEEPVTIPQNSAKPSGAMVDEERSFFVRTGNTGGDDDHTKMTITQQNNLFREKNTVIKNIRNMNDSNVRTMPHEQYGLCENENALHTGIENDLRDDNPYPPTENGLYLESGSNFTRGDDNRTYEEHENNLYGRVYNNDNRTVHPEDHTSNDNIQDRLLNVNASNSFDENGCDPMSDRIKRRNTNRRFQKIFKQSATTRLNRKKQRNLIKSVMESLKGNLNEVSSSYPWGKPTGGGDEGTEVEAMRLDIERKRLEVEKMRLEVEVMKTELEGMKVEAEKTRNQIRQDAELCAVRLEHLKSDERRKEESYKNDQRRIEERHQNNERRMEEKHRVELAVFRLP